MLQGKLAELFVDLTLRGNPKAYLLDLKRQSEALSQTLGANSKQFNAFANGTLKQMAQIAKHNREMFANEEAFLQTPKFRQYAKFEAEGNASKRVYELKLATATAQEELKIEKTQKGRDRALAEAQLRRIQRQKAEREEWNRLVAEKGKVGAYLYKAQEKIADMSAVSHSLPGSSMVGMGVGALGFGAMLHNASPEGFNTLTGSFQLLSGEIGQVFLPMVMDVARQIQQLTWWFRSLSKEQKDNIAYWGKWVIGIGAGAAALVVLVNGLLAVTNALAGVGLALKLAFANPAILALIVAVGALGTALYFAHSQAVANISALNSSAAVTSQIQQGNGPLTQQQFSSSLPSWFRQQYLAAQTPEQRQTLIQAALQSNQNQQNIANREFPNAGAAIASQTAQEDARPVPTTADNFFTAIAGIVNPVLQGAGSLIHPAIGRVQMSTRGTRINQAAEGARIQAELEQERAALLALQQGRGVAGVEDGRNTLISSNFQSQNIGIEQAWKQSMQSSLSGGSLEAERHMQHLKALEIIQTNTANTTNAVKGLKIGNGN